jgi:hypothetical protein
MNGPEIIWEHSYSKQIDAYLKQYPRTNEVQSGIDWMLFRFPGIGRTIYGNEYFVYETLAVAGTPSFWVLYRFIHNQNKIHLLAIYAAQDI